MIYIPIVQHLAFLASVAVFWPGSTFSAEKSSENFEALPSEIQKSQQVSKYYC
jgi:hypothetical protein